MKNSSVFAITLTLILVGQLICQDESSKVLGLIGIPRSQTLDKKYGIEINPISLALSNKSRADVFFSFSLFDINRSAEIVFPVAVSSRSDGGYLFGDGDYDMFSVGFQYRYFIKSVQKGFYICGGTKYTYEFGYNTDLWNATYQYQYSVNHKLGTSLGLGYRYFTNSGLYWGFNFSAGRYFTGNKVNLASSFSEVSNKNRFYDIEFLKIGYAF